MTEALPRAAHRATFATVMRPRSLVAKQQAVVIASMLVKNPEVDVLWTTLPQPLDPRGQSLVKGIIESLGGTGPRRSLW